jgi:hypothetical protein
MKHTRMSNFDNRPVRARLSFGYRMHAEVPVFDVPVPAQRFVDRVRAHPSWGQVAEPVRTIIEQLSGDPEAMEREVLRLALRDPVLDAIVDEFTTGGSDTLGPESPFGRREGKRVWYCPEAGCPVEEPGTNHQPDYTGICPRHKKYLIGPR